MMMHRSELHTRTASGQKIAVIGAGVAGITAAYLLSEKHQVTLFEGAERIGGHTNTVVLTTGPDAGLGIDTGFIVLNDWTYPLLHRLLEKLETPVRYADMSFSYQCEETGLLYGSRSINQLFSQRINLISPRFLNMLNGIQRFWRAASELLAAGEIDHAIGLGEFLRDARIPEVTCRHYVLPMAGAIWSSPAEEMQLFPASTILSFFRNHGLLGYRHQPRWQTVVGGSHSYLRAFERVFRGKIQRSTPIRSVRRNTEDVRVITASGEPHSFDQVIIATHADHVLPLLEDADNEERALFSPWTYKENHTVLHHDSTYLPPLRRAVASWNYRRELSRRRHDAISITYSMNLLQGISADNEYCVTLNPEREIGRDKLIREFSYHHPIYSLDAVRTQSRIGEIQGRRRTFFCGSYQGFGFHEDAVRSATGVAQLFGETL